ncbi:MAG: helix-turn-helix domain-containing protein [Filifactoraceae bacterium]
MNKDIGGKVKQLRTQNNMTLKDLSEKTNLSVGFLSQLERGLTSISTDALGSIADVFDIDISYFFIKKKFIESPVVRGYEKEFYVIFPEGCVQYNLSNSLKSKNIFPRLIEILPTATNEQIKSDTHSGEEFIYVLEGVLTVFLNEEPYKLYPGDSIHYSSLDRHYCANYTSKMVKILVVSTPNPFNSN